MKITRFTLGLSAAQLESLRLRFPHLLTDKERIYAALGFEPPL